MPKQNGCTVDMALCPECVQHVRYCAGRSEVSCPFCEASFLPQALSGAQPSAGAVPRGLKQGVLAASFVGATIMAGTSFGCVVGADYGAPMPENQDPYVEEDAGHGDDVSEQSDAGDVGDVGEDDDAGVQEDDE